MLCHADDSVIGGVVALDEGAVLASVGVAVLSLLGVGLFYETFKAATCCTEVEESLCYLV